VGCAAAGNLLTLGIAVQLGAQAPADSPQAQERYEAASIKPSPPREEGGSFLPRDGRFAARNRTLAQLVAYAYDVAGFQLVGGPEWTRTDQFDIEATASSNTLAHQRLMQRLLEERFALRVRREARDSPVLLLLKARADGTIGPNLKPLTTSCQGRREKQQPPCSIRFAPGVIQGATSWSVIANSFTWLAGLKRMVIDKTGLSGEFDVSLKWTSQDLSTRTDAGNPAFQASDSSTLFAALQDQLGLTLEAGRGPVEVLVIESVERPTPD
jgi:uncharacterized protein (TIGR03435 family)